MIILQAISLSIMGVLLKMALCEISLKQLAQGSCSHAAYIFPFTATLCEENALGSLKILIFLETCTTWPSHKGKMLSLSRTNIWQLVWITSEAWESLGQNFTEDKGYFPSQGVKWVYLFFSNTSINEKKEALLDKFQPGE